MLVSAVILIFRVAPKHGRNLIFVYVSICSVVGSLTVMACKGLGIALKQTLGGNSQLTNPVAWMLLVGGALCIMVQMNYLNKALDIFNTSIVTPIYYVMFTTFTIIASAILYKEWAQLNAKDSLGSISGFLTIICGVFLLHAFKDVKFSLRDLYSETLSSRDSRQPIIANGETNIYGDCETNVLMSSVLYENEDSDSDELYVAKSGGGGTKSPQSLNTKF